MTNHPQPAQAATGTHATETPSPWIQRWSHLVPAGARVLDLACGSGRHVRWFAQRGHPVLGVDRDAHSVAAVRALGQQGLVADLEGQAWPLHHNGELLTFGAVIVTNYLWRPLFAPICQSLDHGGVLLYETFAVGQQSVGRPARAEFLLQNGELLHAFGALRVVAYEDGFLTSPGRYVQRIAAIAPVHDSAGATLYPRHALD